jgi:hypothetical protein
MARTMSSGLFLILLNPSSTTNHVLQLWQKNFCFDPKALWRIPFFATSLEPQLSQMVIPITYDDMEG